MLTAQNVGQAPNSHLIGGLTCPQGLASSWLYQDAVDVWAHAVLQLYLGRQDCGMSHVGPVSVLVVVVVRLHRG